MSLGSDGFPSPTLLIALTLNWYEAAAFKKGSTTDRAVALMLANSVDQESGVSGNKSALDIIYRKYAFNEDDKFTTIVLHFSLLDNVFDDRAVAVKPGGPGHIDCFCSLNFIGRHGSRCVWQLNNLQPG